MIKTVQQFEPFSIGRYSAQCVCVHVPVCRRWLEQGCFCTRSKQSSKSSNGVTLLTIAAKEINISMHSKADPFKHTSYFTFPTLLPKGLAGWTHTHYGQCLPPVWFDAHLGKRGSVLEATLTCVSNLLIPSAQLLLETRTQPCSGCSCKSNQCCQLG